MRPKIDLLKTVESLKTPTILAISQDVHLQWVVRWYTKSIDNRGHMTSKKGYHLGSLFEDGLLRDQGLLGLTLKGLKLSRPGILEHCRSVY
jgi:hypothetical protein